MAKKKIIFYVLLFLLLYIGLIAGSKVYYNHMDRKLATFDLNNDGIFSSEEQTPEQQKYQDITISTSRGLIPITGLFIPFIATSLVIIVLESCFYINKHRKGRNDSKNNKH